jgi:hypothetical protein
MFVAVQHTIHDPDAFFARAGDMMPNLPDHLTLHQTFPTRDGARAICIWEAESVEAVRDFLEPEVGAYSRNEYFAVENKEGVALPSTLQPS